MNVALLHFLNCLIAWRGRTPGGALSPAGLIPSVLVVEGLADGKIPEEVEEIDELLVAGEDKDRAMVPGAGDPDRGAASAAPLPDKGLPLPLLLLPISGAVRGPVSVMVIA